MSLLLAAGDAPLATNRPSRGVSIRFETEDPRAELLAARNFGLLWTGDFAHLCLGPCTVTVDPEMYPYLEVAGDGITPSDFFQLNVAAPPTLIRVETGSRGLRALGKGLTITGAIVTGIGLAYGGLTAASASMQGIPGYYALPIEIGLVGLALLIPGIVLMITQTTRVELSEILAHGRGDRTTGWLP